MRDEIIYFAYKAKFLMESSIDGLCLFVQTSLLFVDSPIFANLLFLCCLNSWMCFDSSCLSYIDMSLCVCDWEVVNLVSIYHSCEHFCTKFFALAFYLIYLCISLSQFIFLVHFLQSSRSKLSLGIMEEYLILHSFQYLLDDIVL